MLRIRSLLVPAMYPDGEYLAEVRANLKYCLLGNACWLVKSTSLRCIFDVLVLDEGILYLCLRSNFSFQCPQLMDGMIDPSWRKDERPRGQAAGRSKSPMMSFCNKMICMTRVDQGFSAHGI